MPIRRLNYTNRSRIDRDDVVIVVHQEASPPIFDATLDLGHHRFPPDARVFVEAYRQTTLARFDFGTADHLRQPDDTSLAMFESTAAILFRVRVTSVSGRKGLLLGLADRIPGRSPGDAPDRRPSLLPVRPDDLGEELWCVEFGGEMPCLVVNDQLVNWKETSSDPWFRAAVFPAAMRRILVRILQVDGNADTDGDDWSSQWLRFAASLPGSGPIPENDAEHDEWIEAATAAFARRHRLRSVCTTAGGE